MKMKSKPATLNHVISNKASLLEFERWFKKEFAALKYPSIYHLIIKSAQKEAAKKAWQAREKVY